MPYLLKLLFDFIGYGAAGDREGHIHPTVRVEMSPLNSLAAYSHASYASESSSTANWVAGNFITMGVPGDATATK